MNWKKRIEKSSDDASKIEELGKQKFAEIAASVNNLITPKSSVVTASTIDGTKATTRIVMTFIHELPEDDQEKHEEGLGKLEA